MKRFSPTYLYIKQHSVTGKLYFGKTVQNPVKYKGSGKHWAPHIKVHGREHVETLWYCLFHDEDTIKEFALMCSEMWNIVESDDWLNLTPENGVSIVFTPEMRIKIGKAHKGKILSDEHRAKISETNRNPSIEIRALISIASKDRICTPETREKMSTLRKGILKSDAHKEKISKSLKSRVFSEASKKKMSESGKLRAKPSKESLVKKSLAMSSTRWINKNGI